MPETPSKEDQIREAAERAANKGKTQVRAEVETAPEPIADMAAPEHDSGEPAREPTRATTKAPPINPDAEKAPVMGKSTRDDIVKNFRTRRDEARKDEDADLTDFNNEGLPAELAPRLSRQPVQEELEDEVPPVEATAEETEEEPLAEGDEAVYVIKVRGKEIELTEAQLEALAGKVEGDGTVVQRAQKAAAGDDYLREAKEVLAEAKRVREEVLAQRASPPTKHPGAQDSTQTAEPAAAAGDIEHPDDPFAKAVEAIQFGQPEEAARILREAVTKTTVTSAKGVSEEAITEQQMRREADRADRIGKAFEEANPELAKDEFAREAIINKCVRLQYDDLVTLSKELGIDPAKVPRNSAEIQHWHKFYRAKSFNVRDPEVLLNKAKDDFVAWKGGSAKPAAEPEASRAAPAPRIVVNVDRRVRKASIQQQPSRTVNPRPDVRQQQPAPKDRSAIVQEMKLQRGMPRLPPKQVARAVS